MNIYMFNTSIAVLGIFAFFLAENDLQRANAAEMSIIFAKFGVEITTQPIKIRHIYDKKQ